MNSANLLDIKSNHKNELHFYTLAVNNMESKLRKQFDTQFHQKEKSLCLVKLVKPVLIKL